MKKYAAAIGLLVVFLAVLIPFASSSPDGLEKVAETLGIEEQTPVWNGLMSDYSVGIIGNPYLSTVIAGIFGTLMVLGLSLALGKVLALRKGSENQNGQ